MKSGLNAKITYIVENTDADLLIFGSSAASHNYNSILIENKLGIKSYNAGRDGTGLLYSYGLLKIVLKRYSPKIVILDLHPASLNKNYTDGERIAPLLPYYQNNPELKELVFNRSKYEKYKMYSKIYPFNSLIWDIFRNQTENNRKEFIANKGYLPLNGEIDTGLLIPPIEKMTIGKAKVKLLMDFVNLAMGQNIRVILVLPPEYITRYTYPMDSIRSICAKSDAEVIDFTNDSILINTRDLYFDFVHLNHKGAELFSNRLCDSIMKN
jgi:hypothetical protein